MANNITPKLKAYVQTDATGRVVSGTPVFRTSKPKNGNWREIPMYYRGTNSSSSTTTTSTSSGNGGGTHPTAFVKGFWVTGFACYGNPVDGTMLFYSDSTTLQPGAKVYSNAALTFPIPEGYVFEVSPGYKLVVGSDNALYNFNCTIAYMNADRNNVCTGNSSSYAFGYNNGIIQNATTIYTDFLSAGFNIGQTIYIRFDVGGNPATAQYIVQSRYISTIPGVPVYSFC